MGFKKKLLFLSSLILTLSSQISEARFDSIAGSRFTSARIASLGDSALNISDDVGSGLFYNPANLAKVKSFNLELLNYTLTGNSSLISHFNMNSFNVIDLNTFAPVLQASPGDRYGAGFSIFPSMSFSIFTLGVLYQREFAGVSDSSGNVAYQSLSQLIPTAGVGYRFFNGLVRFGYSLQFLNQASGSVTASAGSTLNYYQGIAQGSALSHNFGMTLMLPAYWSPSLSVVVRNAFDTKYSSFILLPLASGVTGPPSDEPMTVDLAFAFKMRLGQGVISHASFAYRDVQNRSNVPDALTHMGAGLEVSFVDSFFLRGGFRSGYPSAGLGIKKPGTEISLAWYSENIRGSTQDLRDSKFIFQYRSSLY